MTATILILVQDGTETVARATASASARFLTGDAIIFAAGSAAKKAAEEVAERDARKMAEDRAKAA